MSTVVHLRKPWIGHPRRWRPLAGLVLAATLGIRGAAAVTIGPQQPLAKFKSYSVAGDVATGGVGMRNKGAGTIGLTFPSGATVLQAFLYWTIVSDQQPAATGMLNGHAVSGELIAQVGDPCWPTQDAAIHDPPTVFAWVYRAEVTSFVQASNDLTAFPSGLTGGESPVATGAGDAFPLLDGAALVAVYAHAGDATRNIVINDGGETFFGAGSSTSLVWGAPGAIAPIAARAVYVVADGQSAFSGDLAGFDGTAVAGPTTALKTADAFDGADGGGPGAAHGLWDTLSVDVSALVGAGETSGTASVTSGAQFDCLTWVAQIASVVVSLPPTTTTTSTSTTTTLAGGSTSTTTTTRPSTTTTSTTTTTTSTTTTTTTTTTTSTTTTVTTSTTTTSATSSTSTTTTTGTATTASSTSTTTTTTETTTSLASSSTLATTTTTSTTTTTTIVLPGGLHAQQCYALQPFTPFQPVHGVQLANRFGALTVDVRSPWGLCAPADLNGLDADAPADPAHLTAYRLRVRGTGQFHVLHDQALGTPFGELSVDVFGPVRLFVPTAKGLDTPPPPLPPGTIDSFTCYNVQRSPRSPRPNRIPPLHVVTQLEDTTVASPRPRSLCIPTITNGVGSTAGSDLLCYRVRGRRGPLRQLFLNDVFEQAPYDLTTVRRDFCVPVTSRGGGPS